MHKRSVGEPRRRMQSKPVNSDFRLFSIYYVTHTMKKQ